MISATAQKASKESCEGQVATATAPTATRTTPLVTSAPPAAGADTAAPSPRRRPRPRKPRPMIGSQRCNTGVTFCDRINQLPYTGKALAMPGVPSGAHPIFSQANVMAELQAKLARDVDVGRAAWKQSRRPSPPRRSWQRRRRLVDVLTSMDASRISCICGGS